MKELNFTHHNDYSLMKGFGMIHHEGSYEYDPAWMYAQIISQEQSPDAIERRMTRFTQEVRDRDTFYE